MSIGGGHTNTFLRQVHAGVRCVVAKLGDQDGRLNAELLCVNRPLFKEALGGLRWKVFHWQAPWVWPGLADFAQGALNTVVQGEQTEIELCLKLHRLAQGMTDSGREVDWASIENQACTSMPTCAA